MPIISVDTGRTFICSDIETFIAAASRANIAMRYSSRTGRCGTCKYKIVNSESTALYVERGLTDDEKTGGRILGGQEQGMFSKLC